MLPSRSIAGLPPSAPPPSPPRTCLASWTPLAPLLLAPMLCAACLLVLPWSGCCCKEGWGADWLPEGIRPVLGREAWDAFVRNVFVCVHVCVCLCVHVCVRVFQCVRACVRCWVGKPGMHLREMCLCACVHVCVCVCFSVCARVYGVGSGSLGCI